MAASEPFRYYNRSIFLGLIIGYVVGLLIVIAPYALIASTTDTTAGHTLLVPIDWLDSLFGIGALLLITESIFVMVYDWRGAVTVRGAVKLQIMRNGKMVNRTLIYVLLYIFLPEVMLPIYLIRTARDQHRVKK